MSEKVCPREKPVAWQLMCSNGEETDWIRMNPPTDAEAADNWRPLYASPAGERIVAAREVTCPHCGMPFEVEL